MTKATSIGKPIEDLSLDHQCTYWVENLGERRQRKYLLRDATHGICQGAQEKYNDRNDDTGMPSNPVADDMAPVPVEQRRCEGVFLSIWTPCTTLRATIEERRSEKVIGGKHGKEVLQQKQGLVLRCQLCGQMAGGRNKVCIIAGRERKYSEGMAGLGSLPGIHPVEGQREG